jgi:hypothetical protein
MSEELAARRWVALPSGLGDGRVRRKRCRLEREVVVGKMGVRVRKPYI